MDCVLSEASLFYLGVPFLGANSYELDGASDPLHCKRGRFVMLYHFPPFLGENSYGLDHHGASDPLYCKRGGFVML